MRPKLQAKVRFGEPWECWPWTGNNTNEEYGRLIVPLAVRAGGYRSVKAHRLSWMLAVGPIPEGLCVCHACDYPPCCNPVHLFLGTHAENVRDSSLKGRRRAPRNTAEANPRAKLTWTDVRAIRAAISGGATQRQVAEQFGIRQPNVSAIIHHERWWPDPAGSAARSDMPDVRQHGAGRYVAF